MQPKSLGYFFHHQVANFFEGLFNMLLYFPYLFSVTTLLRTLFSPWKGLTDKTRSRGLDLGELFNVMVFNMISVVLGFLIRSSVLGLFFIVQSLYILFIPVITIVYFCSLPLLLAIYLILPSEEHKKAQEKLHFMKTHTLDQKHVQQVSEWFEHDYRERMQKAAWWKLENLYQTIPLATDWATGYTPQLDKYSTEMTGKTYQTHNHHVIGRKKEIALIEEALLRSAEANALIVGDPGVGKHTIVDAFARKVFLGQVNPLLAYRRIIKLNMQTILSVHRSMEKTQAFFSALLREAAHSKGVILVIDNFDRYIMSGEPGEGRVDLSAQLIEFGRTNKLQIIGITTPHAYENYIYFNQNLSRILNVIEVHEVTRQQALIIAMEHVRRLERRYKLTIPYETILSVIEKSDYFITSVPFPEKALNLLDSACVYARESKKDTRVIPAYINEVLSQMTHSPVTLTDDIKHKLLHLEENLARGVLNQDDALHELSSAMRRAFLLLGKRKKPLASFLFLGPTGVGKTETAKTIARSFFGSDKHLIRFDMSLYQSRDDIPKLIGSAELRDPGLLPSAIRDQPYGVLLLDEIEKANRDLLNIFLTVLDEGYFTDGFGKKIDCKKLVIIATSNAGADYLYKQFSAGSTLPDSNALIAYLIEHKYYTPEFLNRFDGVVAYKPISGSGQFPIAKKMLARIAGHLKELYQVELVVQDSTLMRLLEAHYDPAFGARNLERILRDEIEDQAAKLILSGKAQPGSTIRM